MVLLPVVSIANGDYYRNTGSFLRILWSPTDVKQKIEKIILNNTHSSQVWLTLIVQGIEKE